MKSPRLRSYLLSERAVVLESESDQIELELQTHLWAIAHALRDRQICVDIVPGMNNLTAIFDPAQHSAQSVLHLLETLAHSVQVQAMAQREVCVPVHYGGEYGPDLDAVAEHCGLSPRELIQSHCEAQYQVFFLGFQPGFAYLAGLPSKLATPRLAQPRLSVAAGSVGIGGQQTGIYPQTGPGGWRIIGRTDLILFNARQPNPSYLQLGDRLRFVEVA